MPSITLNKKVLESLIGKKLPIEKLKERITYLGVSVEEILGDEIHLEVEPNRPDFLSEQGFARALASFIGTKTGLREYKIQKSGEKVVIDKSVKNVRPFTACALVKNLKFSDEKIREIIQIQEKLHITYGRNRKKVAIGIYPLEHIKLPISFIAKKREDIKFRPLEFPREITGLQILSQHPAGRDYGHLLEGLDKFPIFVDAKGSILSMPPIINSHETGRISESTKEVFIECSGFDYLVLSRCLNMIVTTLADMGGDIYSMDIIFPDGKKVVSPNLSHTSMKIDIDYVNKRLGLKLKEKEIKSLLERMGYSYNDKKVLVPAYRSDVLHQIDLVEDIAIAYGYENFKEEIPDVATIAKESPFEVFKSRVINMLVGLGFIEVKTFHLINKDTQTKDMCYTGSPVELINSSSEEYDSLCMWLIPSLMDVLKRNKHHEYPQNIFGTGTVFKHGKSETKVEECDRLCVLLCGENSDYTRIKQVLDVIFDSLGRTYDSSETTHPSFIDGRVARIKYGDVGIAYLGEISPVVLSNFDLDMPVSALELNFSVLYDIFSKE